jgi:hypothetical protein
MERVVLIPTPTADGRRLVLRAVLDTPLARLRRFFGR